MNVFFKDCRKSDFGHPRSSGCRYWYFIEAESDLNPASEFWEKNAQGSFPEPEIPRNGRLQISHDFSLQSNTIRAQIWPQKGPPLQDSFVEPEIPRNGRLHISYDFSLQSNRIRAQIWLHKGPDPDLEVP